MVLLFVELRKSRGGAGKREEKRGLGLLPHKAEVPVKQHGNENSQMEISNSPLAVKSWSSEERNEPEM